MSLPMIQRSGSDQCLLVHHHLWSFILLFPFIPKFMFQQHSTEVPWAFCVVSSYPNFAHTALSLRMPFPPHIPGDIISTLSSKFIFFLLWEAFFDFLKQKKGTLALRPLCLFPTLTCAHFMSHGWQTHHFPSTPCYFMCHGFACTVTVLPLE